MPITHQTIQRTQYLSLFLTHLLHIFNTELLIYINLSMPYTNNHQSKSYTLSRQSDTHIEQQFSTSGLVYTIQRTDITPIAGSLNSLPLAADKIGTSREPAREPAYARGEWPNRSTQTRPAKRGSERDIFLNTHSRTGTLRTNTGSQTYSSGHKSGRVASIDPDNSRYAFMQEQRPHGGVLQDKGALTNDRTASPQPASVTKAPRSLRTHTKNVRSQTQFVHKHRTVPLTLHVDPLLKAEVQRVASIEALSVSQVGATAIEQWVHRNLHDQHEDTLYPTMRNLVREENRTLGNRLIFFQMRTPLPPNKPASLSQTFSIKS